MPDWAWVVSLFVMLSIGYFIGFCGGMWNAEDDCPSENAWINVRKYSIDAQKETALAEIEAAHEEEIRMIERGVYDHLELNEDTAVEVSEDGSD